MNNDLVKGEVSADQLQGILDLVSQIQKQLPFLIDLNANDRRSLPKLGDKSRAFVDQGLVLATQNSGILPRNFDIEEYRRDVALVRQLEPVVLGSASWPGAWRIPCWRPVAMPIAKLCWFTRRRNWPARTVRWNSIWTAWAAASPAGSPGPRPCLPPVEASDAGGGCRPPPFSKRS